jgi:antitoxin MazE
MEAAKISLDQQVDIREEHGRVVIEPIRPKAYDLGELIAGITDDNKHGEVDFGGPVGKEAL